MRPLIAGRTGYCVGVLSKLPSGSRPKAGASALQGRGSLSQISKRWAKHDRLQLRVTATLTDEDLDGKEVGTRRCRREPLKTGTFRFSFSREGPKKPSAGAGSQSEGAILINSTIGVRRLVYTL